MDSDEESFRVVEDEVPFELDMEFEPVRNPEEDNPDWNYTEDTEYTDPDIVCENMFTWLVAQ